MTNKNMTMLGKLRVLCYFCITDYLRQSFRHDVEDRGGILMWVGGKMLFDDGESAPT